VGVQIKWLGFINRKLLTCVASVFIIFYAASLVLRTQKQQRAIAYGKRTILKREVKLHNPQGLRHRIKALIPDAYFMEGFDDCIIGFKRSFGDRASVAYDTSKVIQKLQRVHKMTQDEAISYHETKQLAAWVGDHTPCFVTLNQEL
jgi:hypothetical protein